MTDITNEHIKSLAVETHSRQADEFAQSYATFDAYKDCFNYSRHRLDALLQHELPPTDRGLALLDVGCGTGHHMQRYARLGYRVSGVDGSEEMLRHARNNNPGVDIRRADVDALPFGDASFDVVIAIEVTRYVPDRTRMYAELSRVLKPGGYAIVTASPLFSLNFFPVFNRLARMVPLPGFVRIQQFFDTTSGLRRDFTNAGFSSVDVHGVYFGSVNWVEKLARPLTPRFLRAWEPLDRKLADAPLLRELSNMFLVRAVK
jgi:ubiquinone/menaquinone biosynthesis C-methylase UbiE